MLLTDRTEIDFDKKGNWLEVDCKKSAVPEALIPVPVKEYVKANFPREIITKIERGRTGVEIELGNDYSLKFNKRESSSAWTIDSPVTINLNFIEMMRMKIQMLAMMFIAALALGACSDDDDKDDVKVPEAMSQALKSNTLPQSMWNGNRKGAISLQIVKWMGRKRMYGSIIRRNGN